MPCSSSLTAAPGFRSSIPSQTIRGSGFRSGVTVSIGGKSAVATFVDIDTLTVTTPAFPAGPQQILISNPDGEIAAFDHRPHGQLIAAPISQHRFG